MSYKGFKVLKQDMQDFFIPKKNQYNEMINSISNGTPGYGQIIYNYIGPGNFSLNSYNVWGYVGGASYEMIIKTPDGTLYSESNAGPSLWGVDSDTGINFLAGQTTIPGLVKFKYCNNCSGRNGLPLPIIDGFKQRFTYLEDLKLEYSKDYGYIFYDFEKPANQRWFPAVVDSNSGSFIFKDYTGSIKTESQISLETNIPASVITSALEDSKPLYPPTCNKIVLSYSISLNDVCSNPFYEYEYDGNNSILYDLNYCGVRYANRGYYFDGENVSFWDGNTFEKYGPCPYTTSTIRHCCNGTEYVINGAYTVGAVLYTKDVFPAECYEVVSIGSDRTTTEMTFTEYRGGCRDCTANYRGGCK